MIKLERSTLICNMSMNNTNNDKLLDAIKDDRFIKLLDKLYGSESSNMQKSVDIANALNETNTGASWCIPVMTNDAIVIDANNCHIIISGKDGYKISNCSMSPSIHTNDILRYLECYYLDKEIE